MTQTDTRWPHGESEMAGRIRAHDWAGTSLGSITGWPQPLRTMTDLILAMPGPATILWGPAHVQLYNDAYVRIAKDRHPALLGRPAAEGWPDVYEDVLVPLLTMIDAGRAAQLTDYSVALLTPDGGEEERTFDTTRSPIRDEAGAVAGALQTLVEVTDIHRAQAVLRASEDRQSFLLRLSDALRPLVDPDAMRIVASRVLGEAVDADRVYFGDIDPNGRDSTAWPGYVRGGETSPTATFPTDSYAEVFAALWSGRTYVACDIPNSGLFSERTKLTYASVGFEAFISVPLPKAEHVLWTLSAASKRPRAWTERDVGLVRETLERTWDAAERARAEAALRESEERYRSAARIGRTGSWETDFVTRVRRWSPEGMALFGLDLPDEEGHVGGDQDEWRAALHPEDRDLPALVRATLEREDRLTVEYRIMRADGCIVWLQGHAEVTARDAEGRVMRILNVSADVTKQRLAEQALRESEARFSQFAASSSDGLWIRDATTLAMEYTSPAIQAIYGVPPETLLGDVERWAALILPEDRDIAREHLEQARAGEAVVHEFRIRRPFDGEVRWIRNTDFPLHDARGRVQRIGGIAEDVTELKQAEVALVAAEARQRTLAEGIPQLVWRSCEEGMWTWASPQWLAFTGQSQEESRGLGWLDAVHPDDHAATLRAWEEARPHGTLDVEYRVRRVADGAWLWHRTRSVPVRDEAGAIVEWLGTSTDVEQLKELQERQGVLVAELQHRTRNLLGVVRATADKTLARSVDLADFRARFGDRLAALARVQGLLSRLGEWDRVTFDDLIRSELSAMNGEAERISLDGPAGVALRSSTVQTFALALHELATNALKYGALAQPQGQLAIVWRLDRADGDGRPWLHVDWRESGVAMPDGAAGPQGGGSGRELIERALPYQLGARTTYVMAQDGVHCTIALPVSERQRVRNGADGEKVDA